MEVKHGSTVDGAPKRLREGLRSELTEMLNLPTIEEARARRDEDSWSGFNLKVALSGSSSLLLGTGITESLR